MSEDHGCFGDTSMLTCAKVQHKQDAAHVADTGTQVVVLQFWWKPDHPDWCLWNKSCHCSWAVLHALHEGLTVLVVWHCNTTTSDPNTNTNTNTPNGCSEIQDMVVTCKQTWLLCSLQHYQMIHGTMSLKNTPTECSWWPQQFCLIQDSNIQISWMMRWPVTLFCKNLFVKILRKFTCCFSTSRGAGQCYQHGARGLAQRWNPDGILLLDEANNQDTQHTTHNTQHITKDLIGKPNQSNNKPHGNKEGLAASLDIETCPHWHLSDHSFWCRALNSVVIKSAWASMHMIREQSEREIFCSQSDSCWLFSSKELKSSLKLIIVIYLKHPHVVNRHVCLVRMDRHTLPTG